MYVENWDKLLGEKACRQLGFPGFIKNLHSQEFRNLVKNTNFAFGTNDEELYCCPVKNHDTAGKVGLVCEPGIVGQLVMPHVL